MREKSEEGKDKKKSKLMCLLMMAQSKQEKDYTRSDEKSFLGIKANGPVFLGSFLIVFALVVINLSSIKNIVTVCTDFE